MRVSGATLCPPGQSNKAIGPESPIGPCIATFRVDNRPACCFRKRWAPSQREMQPQQGRTASPLRTQRQRPHGLRKTSLQTVGLNAEKKIGIEPKASCFLLTFPLIGLVRLPRQTRHLGEMACYDAIQ